MFNANKEMKKLENQQKAQEQLNQLNGAIKDIDKMISDFYKEAQEYLMNNNEVGFELLANNILYFTDVRNMIDTVRIQFQTYVKTAQFMDTIEGIRPILKNTANMMANMPSYNKNNKDFAKFRKGLMRGQVNMKAMASMCSTINPAAQTTRTREEMDALRERVLMGGNTATPGMTMGMTTGMGMGATVTAPAAPQVNTNNVPETSRISQNEDFFNAIND